ncbi:type I DNA topoisomerase [Buchnera aphidicola (Hyadaphis tataricae)]|uniref:DNA topoisomerase 1 n=1 Tax=Buchnera aphidicola (Hyadaphis tataricae) TaxID=1241859 RepID=A0A4D6YAX7_9GAMM|nr:type I DNA topoisomerase [Buchnera aphidicola]QCI21585.1 type I DNA topoisomerase [Buchnera aphidicola (Hyadaphis tataricae)]
MQKSLVIVESPAKAKTINQYLGCQYIVKSSIGHVRDLLAKKNKKKTNKSIKKCQNSASNADEINCLMKTIGINPYKNWQAEYHILPEKEKIISELKTISNQVDYIYLATDLDREGEAIAWHLKEVIGGDASKFKRVVFNEITKKSIKKAFQNVSDINIPRVQAQQARRFMDRIVGYMISPLLWKKIARGLSAGRVQSVAVRIISEREHVIKNFIPKEYWKCNVSLFLKKDINVIMDLTHYKNKKFDVFKKCELDSFAETIKKSEFVVKSREDKILHITAPTPFITSTLQQSSSIILGFSVKKTMFLAQKLYEKGYITYMRTDSTYLSKHAIKKVRLYIKKHYGDNYLPKMANKYANSQYSQEAHEAIRPSDVEIEYINTNNVNLEAQKLYTLIRKQFIASQMSSAIYKSITIVVTADQFKLQKNEKVIIFQGWKKVIKKEKQETSRCLSLNIGNILNLEKIIFIQKFTKPLARFNEASLVRELEKKGIGRPSTYSSITSKIQERGYVKIKEKQLYAEKMGEILTTRLQKNFSNLLDYNFTANMEKKLDEIADNKIKWTDVLDAFFKDFSKRLEQAKKAPEEGGMELNFVVMTSIQCSSCCKKMGIKNAMTGVFLSCSGYDAPLQDRCKQTINLIPLNDIHHSKNNSVKNIHQCNECKMAMDSYLINHKLKIHVCINNPSCIGYKLEEGNFDSPSYLSAIVKCEKCQNYMILKNGRFGKFFICMTKQCKNTRKVLANGEISEPKLEPINFPQLLCKESDAWFVLREGISGIFFAANTFPKSRETRSPFIYELDKFKNLLPEKIRYLASAPKVDNKGNNTIVCFNRKTKQYYIGSKKNGKLTNWSAMFLEKKWCIINKIK